MGTSREGKHEVQLICELLTVERCTVGCRYTCTYIHTYVHTVIKWCWPYCSTCTCMYVQVLESLPLDLHHPRQELTAKDVDLESLNSSIAQLQSDTSDKDAMIVSGSFYLTWYMCTYVHHMRMYVHLSMCSLMYMCVPTYVFCVIFGISMYLVFQHFSHLL